MGITSNKICLFAGNYKISDWAVCDGKNSTPNIPSLVCGTVKIPYICCIKDINYDDCFLGQILLYAGHLIPKGWTLCQGQMLKCQEHNMLFMVLENNYGGDGQTTFALPNLTPLPSSIKGRSPVSYIIRTSEDSIYPRRAR